MVVSAFFNKIFRYTMASSTFSFFLKKPLYKNCLTLYHTILTFNHPEETSFFGNIVAKGENAGNQHFLLLPQCFLPYQSQIETIE